ncbi:arylamine N-acetyltransferase [Chloroflexota bacterium]
MNIPYPVMSSDSLDRYLRLLGVQRREPSFEVLCELVQAHLMKIPFENISKLYYIKQQNLRGLPNLELFLDGVERFHFGGTCYTNNYYFFQLLANLGYQIKLCGADMTNPDVHLVSMVTVEKRDYLIDAGYAAPFLFPLPLDLTTDCIIELGRDRYVVKPRDANNCSRLELYRNGILKHGYLAKPAPRRIQEFEHTIIDSFRDDSTFMNALLLARFFPDRSLVIHNLTVIESRETVSNAQSLANQDELCQAIYEHFSIPVEITKVALKELGQFGDAWT